MSYDISDVEKNRERRGDRECWGQRVDGNLNRMVRRASLGRQRSCDR